MAVSIDVEIGRIISDVINLEEKTFQISNYANKCNLNDIAIIQSVMYCCRT